MDWVGWIEIEDKSMSFTRSSAYMKEVNGHVLLVRRGLESGRWWTLIDSRPVGFPQAELSEAIRQCELLLERHAELGKD